ncbi:hypothetical protein FDP25_05350 [Roseovarius sp. A21]|uniref:DUF6647 domain-containing protein n=1 Tax=Roseovarius bejariae TaxID=2576383 RepID=A0A844CN09_9RHOB|nr:DUF6647 family protein [Roseovarius bejariae]MRU14855.1 hypothetical protein [Roseovarius bejariae]
MRFLSRARHRLARPSILCLLLLAAPVRAGELLAWREAPDMPALVTHLEDWLDAASDLPRRAAAPAVRLTSRAHVARIAPMRAASDASHTRGLYDPDSETIWLVRPWSAKSPFDVSVLLHELAHHRQAGQGHWYCPGAQELPAYRLQQAWLNELGLEPDVNWIAVILEAGCTARDIHPD